MENNTNSSHEVEFEFATLSLKGKRFQEAEAKFTHLITVTKSSEAWCGLAVAKYGLILDQASIEEVFYCFNKAKLLNNNSDVELVVLQSSFEVIHQLYGLYTNVVTRTRAVNRQKNMAIITTAVSAFTTINALNDRRVLGSIASAGFTALSYDNYLKAGASHVELVSLQSQVVKIIDEIKAHVREFVTIEKDKKDEFNQLTTKREQGVIEALKTEDQRVFEKTNPERAQSNQLAQNTGAQWWEKATAGDRNHDSSDQPIEWYNQKSKLMVSVFFWPAALYGFYKTALIKKETKLLLVAGLVVFAIIVALFGKNEQ